MNRRQMLTRTATLAAALGLTNWHTALAADAGKKKRRVLFFSKSSGFEHSAIKRQGDKPSFAEQVLAELGPKHNIEFTFSKDGSLFSKKYLAQFDAYFFYTTGPLTEEGTDKNPPMSAEGKQAFLDAITGGKGFIGTHSATDTFHTQPDPADKSTRYQHNGDRSDPYLKMIGAEFIKHGAQQPSRMTAVDGKFPGLANHAAGFELTEEWYSLKEFQPNLHVLLVQETGPMKGNEYQRGSYPATWARMHGQGRVFYTSMGHREDVWTNPLFQEILFGGIHWAVRNVDADVTPNLEAAAPKHAELPPPSPAPAPAKKEKKAKK